MKLYQVITKIATAAISVNDEGKITKDETAPIFKWAIGKEFAWFIEYLKKEKILVQYTDIVNKEVITVKEDKLSEPLPVSPIKDKKAIICPECDGIGYSENTKCKECEGKGIISKPIPVEIPEEIEPEKDDEENDDDN